MLLIDGVKYELWSPPSEDEFESVVKEHVNEIFGEQCIYLDKKQKLKSLSGIGSIPDGLAIILGTQPELHIVEYELSNHDVYGHVVSQISKFINGLLNSSTRQKIARIIYDEISGDQLLKIRVEQALNSSEIFKFSTELLDSKPILTIIIESKTEELSEALSPFSYPNIKDMKVVEFQTFIREGVGLPVHAHLFESLYPHRISLVTLTPPPPQTPFISISSGNKEGGKTRKVTFTELVKAGLLEDGQILSFYHTKLFSDERAQVLTSENKLRYQADNKMYSKTGLAECLFRKYNLNFIALRGPQYWMTEDGKLLVDLEEQVRLKRGARK